MHDPARLPTLLSFRKSVHAGRLTFTKYTINNVGGRREAADFAWMRTRKRIERKRGDSGATSGSAFFFSYGGTDGKSEPGNLIFM